MQVGLQVFKSSIDLIVVSYCCYYQLLLLMLMTQQLRNVCGRKVHICLVLIDSLYAAQARDLKTDMVTINLTGTKVGTGYESGR